MFNKYFQDELVFLRELGHEFSEAYPALAPMLADRGGDPDVERLLEGVAFLTGRIRQKLDDELPEVIHALAGLLFPHLARSLPGASIVELKPLPNVLRERRVVERGTEFASVPVDGTRCRFRTCNDVTVVPWTIDSVRLEMLAGGKQQLRINFKAPAGMAIEGAAPDKLRLHLAGDSRTTLGLLMWIYQHTEDVVLIQSNTLGTNEPEVSVGKRAVSLAGFAEDEALLPHEREALPGLRLLQEYYVLPQKFAFIDIASTARLSELQAELESFSIAIRFDEPLHAVSEVTKDNVRLHCVPVVNLFSTTSDPVRLSDDREKYLVKPASLPPGHGEVYRIEAVQAVTRGASTRIDVPPFYDFERVARSDGQVYYSTHLEPGVVGDGADTMISFGTAHKSGVMPQADLLSIDLLATNGRLASAVRVGEITVATPSSPAFTKFSNISAVTGYVPPSLGRDLHWRVISHTAANLRSLLEVEVLRSMLAVYNLHGLVDRQAARANELRIEAIKSLRAKPAERLYRGAAVRGVGIDITLDESGFAGDGDMFLFGAVLDRLFAGYVSLNSFSVVTIEGAQTKVKIAWPARSGDLTLI